MEFRPSRCRIRRKGSFWSIPIAWINASESIARIELLTWEPITAVGLRADIRVLGSEPSDRELIFLGILPEVVDSCYSLRTPISFIEDDNEIKAAVLTVVVW